MRAIPKNRPRFAPFPRTMCPLPLNLTGGVPVGLPARQGGRGHGGLAPHGGGGRGSGWHKRRAYRFGGRGNSAGGSEYPPALCPPPHERCARYRFFPRNVPVGLISRRGEGTRGAKPPTGVVVGVCGWHKAGRGQNGGGSRGISSPRAPANCPRPRSYQMSACLGSVSIVGRSCCNILSTILSNSIDSLSAPRLRVLK